MNKKNIYVSSFVILCFLISGCTKLKYLDELLTLKGLSEEQDEIAEYIDQQKVGVDRLARQIDEGAISNAEDRASIVAQYGEPIFKSTYPDDLLEHEAEMWLYRYAAEFNPPFKIYLFFNDDGQLVRWEKEVFPDGEGE